MTITKYYLGNELIIIGLFFNKETTLFLMSSSYRGYLFFTDYNYVIPVSYIIKFLSIYSFFLYTGPILIAVFISEMVILSSWTESKSVKSDTGMQLGIQKWHLTPSHTSSSATIYKPFKH